MKYVETLHSLLQPTTQGSPLVLDLFAGCGGLALGFEAQGFETLGFEMDADCVATYQRNLSGDCVHAKLSPDFTFPRAQVVIGGPPCQPFSVGGHQQGIRDARDGFPAFIAAVEQAQPDVWMFENVRGLMYRNKPYLEAIITELEAMNYIVDYRLLHAVQHGVPQNRERMFVVGHRGHFVFPKPRPERISAGQAIGDLIGLQSEDAKFLTPSMDRYVANYEKASKCITPRDLHLDRPARTVTCRNLAGATGDMQRVALPDGRRRRLTVREGARLQSFPDWFQFEGKEASRYKQIGNAVPPLLAHAMAGAVRDYLDSSERLGACSIGGLRNPTPISLLTD